MVEQSKREFIDNLKKLMYVFNNLKDASKQNDERRATIFEAGEQQIKDKISYEFKFEENPFDKTVLESK